jgi:hypothetical protein
VNNYPNVCIIYANNEDTTSSNNSPAVLGFTENMGYTNLPIIGPLSNQLCNLHQTLGISGPVGVGGVANTGNGVVGYSNTGIGVYGLASGSGNGVLGYSSTGPGGTFGSGSGPAIYAYSNVGIGTSSPSQLLHIVGNTTNDGTGLAENLRVESSTSEVGIGLNNTSTGGHLWQIESTGSPTFEGAGKLGFYDNTAGAWRMILDGSGNVGIGTYNELYRLDVRTPGSTSAQIHIASTDTDAGGYLTSANDGNLFMSAGAAWNGSAWVAKNTSAYLYGGGPAGVRFFFDTGLTVGNTYSPTARMIIAPSGYVGVGTASPAYLLDVAGQVHATGFPTSSDMRFKMDVQPIDDALEKVLRLNGVYFKWNSLHRETLKRSKGLTSRQVGLIAQQVKEVVPELVSEWADEGADDYLAVDYSRLGALTIEAIKELNEKNEKLKAENDNLRERIEVLELKLAAS